MGVPPYTWKYGLYIETASLDCIKDGITQAMYLSILIYYSHFEAILFKGTWQLTFFSCPGGKLKKFKVGTITPQSQLPGNFCK